MKKTLSALLLAAALGLPSGASAQTAQDFQIPPEFMDALKSDMSQLRTQAMQSAVILQPGQSGTFWTIYDEYLAELESVTEGRAELMKDFAVEFQTLTDEQAVELGHRALDIRMKQAELVRKYFDRIAEEVSGTAAGQFYQVEYQVQILLDLAVASETPLIGG